MPARLFTLADLARRAQVPMSIAYRLLHAGELIPDFVTDRLALFAETRRPAVASLFAARSTVKVVPTFANHRRGPRLHTPRKNRQAHDSGAQHTSQRKGDR